jgi:hypothetical protein
VYEAKCSDTAHISTQNLEPTESEFTQVMNASEKSSPVDSPDYYSTPFSWMIDDDFRHIEPEEDEVIVIQGKFVMYSMDSVILNLPGWHRQQIDTMICRDLLTADCGATTTITKELLNLSNVKP